MRVKTSTLAELEVIPNGKWVDCLRRTEMLYPYQNGQKALMG